MKKETHKSKTYSQQEIGVALNNALVACLGAQGLLGLDERKKRKIRSYTAAIIEVLCDYRKKDDLTAEEVVVVLTGAALFAQVLLVAKGGLKKLAAYEDLAKRTLEDMEK